MHIRYVCIPLYAPKQRTNPDTVIVVDFAMLGAKDKRKSKRRWCARLALAPGWAAPLPILLGRAAPGPGHVCWLRKFQDHAFGAGRDGMYLLYFGGGCERDGKWLSVRYHSLRCNGRGMAHVHINHDAASQTEKPVRQGKPACGNLQGRARR